MAKNRHKRQDAKDEAPAEQCEETKGGGLQVRKKKKKTKIEEGGVIRETTKD